MGNRDSRGPRAVVAFFLVAAVAVRSVRVVAPGCQEAAAELCASHAWGSVALLRCLMSHIDRLPVHCRREVDEARRLLLAPTPPPPPAPCSNRVFVDDVGLALLHIAQATETRVACIVDVGANRGTWTANVRRHFPAAQMHMVEAQPSAEPYLRALGATYDIAVLGSADGAELTFYGSRRDGDVPTGASLLREKTSVYDATGAVPRRVRTTTLDTLLRSRFPGAGAACRRPEIVKLDVQGAELLVLAGSNRTLASAHFVVLEMSLLPYNVGSPLLGEVVAFLQQRGFAMLEVTEAHRLGGLAYPWLFQLDALFVNTASQTWRRLPLVDGNFSRL